jgi:hypothetical protein
MTPTSSIVGSMLNGAMASARTHKRQYEALLGRMEIKKERRVQKRQKKAKAANGNGKGGKAGAGQGRAKGGGGGRSKAGGAGSKGKGKGLAKRNSDGDSGGEISLAGLAALGIDVSDEQLQRMQKTAVVWQRVPVNLGRRSMLGLEVCSEVVQWKYERVKGPPDEWNAECEVCDSVGDLLCCDTCTLVYHLHCLTPALAATPTGDWRCPECEAEGVPFAKAAAAALAAAEEAGRMVVAVALVVNDGAEGGGKEGGGKEGGEEEEEEAEVKAKQGEGEGEGGGADVTADDTMAEAPPIAEEGAGDGMAMEGGGDGTAVAEGADAGTAVAEGADAGTAVAATVVAAVPEAAVPEEKEVAIGASEEVAEGKEAAPKAEEKEVVADEGAAAASAAGDGKGDTPKGGE